MTEQAGDFIKFDGGYRIRLDCLNSVKLELNPWFSHDPGNRIVAKSLSELGSTDAKVIYPLADFQKQSGLGHHAMH